MPNRQGRHPRQPGPFRPRAEIPAGNVAIARLDGRDAAAATQSLAQTQETTAATMGALAAKLSSWADDAAAIEGARAGAVAGGDPAFRPEGRTTIRGRAFERAAIQTYSDQLDAHMRQDIARISDANAGNPAALSQGFAALKKNYLKAHVFPEIAGRFEAAFDRATLAPVRQAHRAVVARAREARTASLETDLAERRKSIERTAYAGGLDADADEAIAAEIADMQAALGGTGPDGRPLVGAKGIARELRAARESAAQGRFRGAFDRIETLDGRQRFLERFEEDYSQGADHTTALDLDAFQRLQGYMRAGISRTRSTANQGLNLLKGEIGSFEALAAKGMAPTDEAMAGLAGRVAASGEDALIERMSQATQTFATLRTAAAMPPAVLAAQISEWRGRMMRGGASEPELHRLELAEKLRGEMQKGLNNDPVGWAQAAGVIDTLPLDFTAPIDAETQVAPGFQRRRADALTIADHYGVPVKFFSAAERDALAAQFRSSDPDTKLHIAAGLAAGFGDDAGMALSEIAPKAPAAAYLAALAAQNERHMATARDGFRGLTALDEGAIAVPHAEAQRLTGEVLGEALDSRLSGVRGDIEKAARAIYAGRAIDQGVTGFDADLYREAVEDAAGAWNDGGVTRGGVGTYQGRALILPDAMSEADFDRTLEGLAGDDLARLSASGGLPVHRNIRGQQVKASAGDVRGGYLVSVGPGRYQVSTTDPSVAPGYLLDAGTGGYWVLDMSSLRPDAGRTAPLFGPGAP